MVVSMAVVKALGYTKSNIYDVPYGVAEGRPHEPGTTKAEVVHSNAKIPDS